MADADDTSASKSRVLVFARCRPPSDKETARGDGEAISMQYEKDQVTVKSDSDAIDRVLSGQAIANPEKATSDKSFVYDGCFGGDSSQKDVFSLVGLPVLVEVMKGFNGCVLAYGQTGSGKTYSLLNTGADAEQAGLLPRLVATLFVRAAMDPKHVYSIEAAAFQVYNEQVDDLLHPDFGQKNSAACNLGVTKGTVHNLTWTKCTKPTEMLELFNRARSGITYAETKMNKASSRSHAAFQVKIIKRPRATSKVGKGGASLSMHATVGKLTVVDLAGSERVKKSGVTGANFKEATNINGSLLALGNVIQALASKSKHVPFRNSKLTKILEGSVGGNCKTSLLVCISPAAFNASETLSTLEFASRAMRVEVEATVNETIVEVDPARLAADLQANPGEYMDDETLKAYRESEEALKSAKEQAKHHEEVVEGFKSKMKEMELVVTRKQREIEEAKVVAERQVLTLRKNLDSIETEKKKTFAKVSDLELQLQKQKEHAIQIEKAHSKEVMELRKANSDEIRKRDNKEKEDLRKAKDAETVWNAKLSAMQEKSDKANKELLKLQKAIKDLNTDSKKAHAAVASEKQARKKLQEELENVKSNLAKNTSGLEAKDESIREMKEKLEVYEAEIAASTAREVSLKNNAEVLNQEIAQGKVQIEKFEKQIVETEQVLESERKAIEIAKEQQVLLSEQLKSMNSTLEQLREHAAELECKLEESKKQNQELQESFMQRETESKKAYEQNIQEANDKHAQELGRVQLHSTEAMNALEVRAAEDTAKYQAKLQAAEAHQEQLIVQHQDKIQNLEASLAEQVQRSKQREVELEKKSQQLLEKIRLEHQQVQDKAALRLAYTIASQQAARAAKSREIKRIRAQYRALEKRFKSRESRHEDLSLIRAQQKALREKDSKLRDTVREVRRKELELDAHRQQDRIFGQDASKKRTVLPGRYVGEHATFKERAQVIPTNTHTASTGVLGLGGGHIGSTEVNNPRARSNSPTLSSTTGGPATTSRPSTSPRPRPGTADPVMHTSPRGEKDGSGKQRSDGSHSKLQKPRRPSRSNIPLPPTHLYSSGLNNNSEFDSVIGSTTYQRTRRNSVN